MRAGPFCFVRRFLPQSLLVSAAAMPHLEQSLKFRPYQVEKPWGREQIPEIFGETGGRRIGEIWFEPPDSVDLPLLVKYIFTSEKLSVQVHPSDEQARARQLSRGKAECWYILNAEAGAKVGLGLHTPLSAAEIRKAAVEGYLEELMEWKPVNAGDFFYVPPGTIHAIGAGVALLEFQQNADVTYRLYDYCRPRELHIDDAVAVSTGARYPQECWRSSNEGCGPILLNGPLFSLMRVSSSDDILAAVTDRRRWVMPLEGFVSAGEDTASAGECLLVEEHVDLRLSSCSVVLCGAEGAI